MNKKYDVCAIGNALVDYEIAVDDQFLINHGVEKGLMTLVEEETQVSILSSLDKSTLNRCIVRLT